MIKWNIVLQFVLLLVLWFVFAGTVNWQHTVAGVTAVALVMLFWRHKQVDKPRPGLWGFVYAPLLAVVLLVEIFRSAWGVAMIILLRRPISPSFFWVESGLKTDFCLLLFSNCITLTPGTLTVSLDGNRLQIHALTEQHAKGVEGGIVHRLLARMEGSA